MARRKYIPKRIGNVKIPKKLRKFGDRVLADPRAREIAGGALLAVGSALLSRAAPKGSVFRTIFDHPVETAKSAEQAGAKAASDAGDAVSGVANAVGQVVGEVFDSLRRELGRRRQPATAAPEKGDDEAGHRDVDEDRVH
ncbi:hypothetical protein [Rubellimicrobium arenae]|uniref:hypothetical protein n=1 Tax=Rubellimicrobium arenae TaxID=2817372 RepID=UPI001B30B5A0|nr:hypothetical protein [Rubellimicrobium arenae]